MRRASIYPPPAAREKNATAAKERLRGGFCLLRAARWQEGLAVASGFPLHSVRAAVQSKARWVGREPGSAARELLDELLPKRRPPRHIAYGHRGVAEAIRCGWADIGVCLGPGERGGRFGFPQRPRGGVRFVLSRGTRRRSPHPALVEAVRSASYRGMLGDLPGYNSTEVGELERIP